MPYPIPRRALAIVLMGLALAPSTAPAARAQAPQATSSQPQAAQSQAPQTVPGARTLDSDGVIALIGSTPELVIIDARHPKDYADGHIEGASRLLDEDMLAAGPASLAALVPNTAVPLLFYCNGPACGRAAKSAAAAVGWGYSKVNYYYAGIPDWRAKNLPLVK